MKNKIVVVM